MANILVFSFRLPYPVYLNGYTLRVFPLSKELSKKHSCFLATFGEKDEQYQLLRETGTYKDIALMPLPAGRKSPLRHVHLYNGDQTEVGLPREYRRVTSSLQRLVEEWRIDLIIVYGSGLMEYIKPFSGLPKIMDSTDCNSLAIERKNEHVSANQGRIDRLKAGLVLHRKRHLERKLADFFDIIVVVSPIDRDYLRGLCTGGPQQIIDIPNGVNPDLLAKRWAEEKVIPGGLAFWGTLDFPPNATAVHYFYDEVFRPYLAEKEVTWFIIGKNPSLQMREMVKRHPNIQLTGYVDDLFGLVSRIPIMVNPIQIGGGIKNKVIEAFALERLVVSNNIGMEAIFAKNGLQYVHAETPREFAEAVLEYSMDEKKRACIGAEARSLVKERYNWTKIGKEYCELVDGLLQTWEKGQTFGNSR